MIRLEFDVWVLFLYSLSSTDNTNVAASTANIKPHETGDNESNTKEFTTNGMYCMVTMYN